MNEITILQETAADVTADAELKLARIVAQLQREGLAFDVFEDVAAHFSGLGSRRCYVIKISGH